MTDVSIIVVTYNSAQLIRACLDAAEAAVGDCSCEILVIDNASSDDTLKVVAETAPSARIVRNESNAGFAAASNQGIRAARGRYFLLLNPDAVPSSLSIETLVAYMDAHARAGIAGPMLHERDGRIQYSVRNFPSPTNQWFEALFLHRVEPRLSGRFGEVVYDDDSYATSRAVNWVSGAAMILRPEALEQVGLLDERFFMYSEEKDLCYRMVLAGWTVCYVSDAHVTHAHDGHESAEAFARQLASKLMYFDKHCRGMRRLGCKTGLYAGFATRVFAGMLAALVGSERRHHLLVPLRGVPLYMQSRGNQLRRAAQ